MSRPDTIHSILSSEEKEKVHDKLKYAKKYRLKYTRTYKNAQLGKMVEDALSKTELVE